MKSFGRRFRGALLLPLLLLVLLPAAARADCPPWTIEIWVGWWCSSGVPGTDGSFQCWDKIVCYDPFLNVISRLGAAPGSGPALVNAQSRPAFESRLSVLNLPPRTTAKADRPGTVMLASRL